MKVKVKVIIGLWNNVTHHEIEMTEQEFKEFQGKMKKIFKGFFNGEGFSISLPHVLAWSKV